MGGSRHVFRNTILESAIVFRHPSYAEDMAVRSRSHRFIPLSEKRHMHSKQPHSLWYRLSLAKIRDGALVKGPVGTRTAWLPLGSRSFPLAVGTVGTAAIILLVG